MTTDPDAPRDEREPSTVTETAGRLVGGALASGKQLAVRTRATIRKSPKADRAYRVAVGVAGGTTVALGVVLMPLPGPGTLIALGGVGMLGSEFEGAKKVSTRATAVVKTVTTRVADARAKSAEKRATQK